MTIELEINIKDVEIKINITVVELKIHIRDMHGRKLGVSRHITALYYNS
jgi:hypothetical protein